MTKEENQQVIVTQAATKYISVGAGRVVANLGGIFSLKTREKLDIFIMDLLYPTDAATHDDCHSLWGASSCVLPRLVSSGRGEKN